MSNRVDGKQGRSGRRLPVYKKALYSLIPTLLVIGGLELCLALLGVAPLSDTRDPYVGFSQTVPLLEEVVGPGDQRLMVTRPSKLVWFNAQQFLKVKPAGTYRVFCLGGSTTYGRPYADTTSFCGWMREYLPLVDESRDWEVINAGGVSYASYRVAMVMQELSRYEPDLFVVYCAHNEFLEKRTYAGLVAQPTAWLGVQGLLSKTRIFALSTQLMESRWRPANPASARVASGSDKELELLPAEVDERLNHTIGPQDYERDAAWEQNVLLHYQENLRRMIKIARNCRAKIVFVTPASNLKDCSPFKALPGELGPAEQQESRQLVSQIETLQAADRDQQILPLLRNAAKLDPQNAAVQYRLGRALFSAGLESEAESAFRRALNEDVCALRAIDEIDQAVRRVANESQLPLVDFAGLLTAKCLEQFGHACLGQEYFLDHVHPTIEVHEQLARWIIGELQQSGIVTGTSIEDPQLAADMAAAREQHLQRIDRRQHGIALRNLAKVLHWSGKFSAAAPRARDALTWIGEDAESRFVLADCLKNMSQPDEARQQYELLFASHPDYSRAFLPYGELLVELGDTEQGLGFLLSAILAEPENDYAHLTLGRCHLQRNENHLAIESFEMARQLNPHDPTILAWLAEARAAQTAASAEP